MIVSNKQLLNTPIEVGTRALIILSINKEKYFDIERLTYYDYICTRLNDYNKNYESLHPSNPYRNGEILVKRELLKKGLLILAKKDLIYIMYNSKGVLYKANEFSECFLKQFNSLYFKKFSNYVVKASDILNDIPTTELRSFFKRFSESIVEESAFESVIRGE